MGFAPISLFRMGLAEQTAPWSTCFDSAVLQLSSAWSAVHFYNATLDKRHEGIALRRSLSEAAQLAVGSCWIEGSGAG